jgi:excisionase family DNA binding protein
VIERRTYSVSEAAALLGVSRGVAYEAAKTGELPTVRLGRRLLVPRARLEALLGEPRNGDGPADDRADAKSADEGGSAGLEP